MRRWLEELRHRNPNFGESENIHEIAKEVRNVTLNAIDFGAIGSEFEIPGAPSKEAIKLPTLLHYSPTILAHLRTLRGVLSEPHEFQIVDQVGQPWRDDVPDGDIIYRKEGPSHAYYFTSHLTSPYLNAWAAAIDSLQRGVPFLNIAIMQNNDTHKGVWMTNYAFTDHYDMSSDNNVHMSNLYPERNMTLQFWFSPKRLSAQYIFDHLGCANIVKDHLRIVEDRVENKFRQVVFHFDGNRLADIEESERIWRDDLPDIYAAFLRKRGDFDFSVVEIGKAQLGKGDYYIYTGSETARIEEKSEQRVKNASRRFVWKY